MSLIYNGVKITSIKFIDPNGISHYNKKLIKDGTIIWVKPYIYSYTLGGNAISTDISATVNSTLEPSASTGAKENYSEIYFEDSMSVSYRTGSGVYTEVTYNPDIMTLKAPSLSLLYMEGYGANCKNNNSVQVTVKYYVMSDGVRYPTSGYYTETINSGGTKWLGRYQKNAVIYAYFETSRTTITTRITVSYSSGSVTGLSETTSSSRTLFDNVVEVTVSGKVLNSDVNTNISATRSSSTTSIQGSISSSSSSITLK